MKKPLLIIFVIFTLFGQAHAAGDKATREKAKQLNTQGFRLYKQGKYYQALPLFHRATQADSRYALAQYNFASTASRVLDDFDCKQQELDYLRKLSEPDNIFAALKKATTLDPNRLERSKTDPDLTLVRKSFRYYRDILGYSPKNDSQLKIMLQRIDWQSDEMRLYHTEPIVRLLFQENGKIQVKIATPIDGEIPKGSPPWRYSYKNGNYDVKDGIVTLTFNSPSKGKQKIIGKLNDDGILTFANTTDNDILPISRYRFLWPMHFC